MAVAIISDIHGNLEALTTIFKYLSTRGIDDIYCLGDIVGYGPNPNECVELVAKKCSTVIMGNHDHAVLGLTSTEYFNDFAKISTHWTREHLTAENMHFLSTLPFVYDTDDFYLVHASPSHPEQWNYVLTELDAHNEFDYFKQLVCFIGHSHFPIVFHKNGFTRDAVMLFEKRNKYIVNVGSVGQPRDGNPLCSFSIYDADKREMEYVRLDYEIEKTCEKIIKAGLPNFLAERLTKGF